MTIWEMKCKNAIHYFQLSFAVVHAIPEKAKAALDFSLATFEPTARDRDVNKSGCSLYNDTALVSCVFMRKPKLSLLTFWSLYLTKHKVGIKDRSVTFLQVAPAISKSLAQRMS